MSRNWREVAERWNMFVGTSVGKAFLNYQTEHDKAVTADIELSFQSNNPNDSKVRELHRNSEKALELFVKEVEVLLENQKDQLTTSVVNSLLSTEQ